MTPKSSPRTMGGARPLASWLLFVAALSVPLAATAKGGATKPADATKTEAKGPLVGETFAGLELRSLGPALTSGRVGDLAIHPSAPGTWYVAAASGGVWKTTNAGTTFEPIFDSEGSYSIGCVTIDPSTPLTVWVGTGENNSQRSVSYGDGVYKSTDAGRSWTNVGLKESEHIGKILVDPRDSRVAWVAAQGPLWRDGGDRGLYKTVDGGKSWKKVLAISDRTGVSDIAFDPRNADVVYASAYQRRRHVWTLLAGGPEGGLHKTTDGGATWTKLDRGLPAKKVDVGRIGLAVAPSSPDVVYALVEAADGQSGLYRSTDAGANWEKRSDYNSGSAQYYQELFVDPAEPARLYSMDTWLKVSEDGGATFRNVGEKTKHVDNHALWIDPTNTRHLLSGCDGGLYETWDRGETWSYFANLPITQFYKMTVDDARPFYNVYGGTQDNFTQGGPVRTRTNNGIVNSDWFITVGGDGFQPRVDPTDPNVVYSQAQHGALVRFDRRTGERIDIQPQSGPGEPPLRFNWDSPLVISPHSPKRLYFGANRLFRSDDRGDGWRAVSPDLTRQIDRNKLPVMGRIWSPDAVAKNASTSFYGNLVALSESPKVEGLLYAGTDDGLVQVSEDGGARWRRVESFPGVPDKSYVSRLDASLHDASTVYAAFSNHKMGDFAPYLLRSPDRGKSWVSLAGDLPKRGSVWAFAEDPVNPKLLFAGTEFGLFFTLDGGTKWIPLTGGLPTIAVRDLAIQKREGDLVVATFGRGFYVLDDLSPLRRASEQLLSKEIVTFAVPPALLYVPAEPLGGEGKAWQGDRFFTALNPPFGAVLTYFLKDELRSKRDLRLDEERRKQEKGEDTPYPSWEALAAEAREEAPELLVTIADDAGLEIRRLAVPATKGFHRIAWDLRYPVSTPTRLEEPGERAPWEPAPVGPLVLPGTYTATFARRVDGKLVPWGDPQSFDVVPLGAAELTAADREAIFAFAKSTSRLRRAVLGATEILGEAKTRLDTLRKAIDETPGAPLALADEARTLEARRRDLEIALTGDPVRRKYNEPAPPSVVDRVEQIVFGHWWTTSPPTATHRQAYDIAAAEFEPVLGKIRTLVDTDLRAFEAKVEAAGAPWTPGRVPEWKRE